MLGTVITSSPGPISSAHSRRCIPAVPEDRAAECLHPAYSQNFFSNSAFFTPVVIQPEPSTSATAFISSLLTEGREKGKNSFRMVNNSLKIFCLFPLASPENLKKPRRRSLCRRRYQVQKKTSYIFISIFCTFALVESLYLFISEFGVKEFQTEFSEAPNFLKINRLFRKNCLSSEMNGYI